MRVLLLQPPWNEVYGRFSTFTNVLNRCPPLTLYYLASSLKAAGHEAKVVDLELLPRLRSTLFSVIEEAKPDLVGLTGSSPIFHLVCRIAKIVEDQFNLPVVIGGPHVTIDAERALEEAEGATYALLGEADYSVSRFVDALEGNGDLSEVPGLLVREGDRIVRYGDPQQIDDLDALPELSFDGFDSKSYLWSVKGRGIVPGCTYVTGRGCPYNCMFCANAALSKRRVRFRDAEGVVDEVVRLYRDYGVRHLAFMDDTLNLKRERMLAISDRLRSADLDLTWEGDTRADRLDLELLQAMAAAGCTRINVGVESGDPDILASLDKRLSIDQVLSALSWAKQAGIETRATAIIGLPGETRGTIKRTVDFLKNLKDLDQLYLNIAMPYLGTRLRELALAGEGGLQIVDDRWESMRRWGNAVMRVGDIEPEEMVRIHNRAVVRIYATPHRIWHNLRRSGLLNGIRMALMFTWRVILRRAGKAVDPYTS